MTAVAEPKPSADVADAPARLLVVDDTEGNREALARRLRRRGFEVDVAEDGETALAAIDANDYDAVLLDVMMPGISGIDVLTRVRETRSPTDLPIIMATARDESEHVVEALNLGANDYVTKPLDFPVVLARTNTAVQLRQRVREVQALQATLARRNEELEETVERTNRELAMAAEVQRTFLPKANPASEAIELAWRFEPCAGLAGDGLGALRLDADHVALFLFDVSGHGTAAALTAVAAARMLAPAHDPATLLVDRDADTPPDAPKPIVAPADVVAELDARFPFTFETRQFLTVFYGLLHLPTRRLTYASAGHPPALHLRPSGEVELLESNGPPVSMGERCSETTVQLAVGSRLFIHSDGITEAVNPDRQFFDEVRLLASVRQSRDASLPDTLDRVLADVVAWRGGGAATDDVSLLAIEML